MARIPVYEFEIGDIENPRGSEYTTLRTYRLSLVRETTVHIPNEDIVLSGPQQAARVARTIVGDYDREAILVLALNTRMRVIAAHIATIGILDMSLIHPREIYKMAILSSAHSIVLAHNHPSGDPSPSLDDQTAFERIREAGKIVGIEARDFLVIGESTYWSLVNGSTGRY